MKGLGIALIALAAGCASSGPVKIGQDTYMISKQSATGFSSAGAVKADIYREGAAYCVSQGKEFQPVNEHGVDGVPYRSFASAEVQFRCLNRGDPELSRPTMQPVPNVRIQNEIVERKDARVQESDDKYAELKKLKALLDNGTITQDEFDAQKKRILAK